MAERPEEGASLGRKREKGAGRTPRLVVEEDETRGAGLHKENYRLAEYKLDLQRVIHGCRRRSPAQVRLEPVKFALHLLQLADLLEAGPLHEGEGPLDGLEGLREPLLLRRPLGLGG